MSDRRIPRVRSAPLATVLGLLGGLAGSVMAQTVESPPVNGMRPVELRTHAILDATVIPAPGQRLEHATIVLRDGVIVALGTDVAVPDGARTWDAAGLTVYPGFIEPALLVDATELPDAPGRHPNGLVRPERRMADAPPLPESTRAPLRSLGFTTAAVHASRGILRGTGAVVSLGAAGELDRTYVADGMASAGFDRGGGYPGSLMGAIAVLRQTLADAQWYGQAAAIDRAHPLGAEPLPPNPALEAMLPLLKQHRVLMFDASNELDELRAVRIAQEFGLDLVLLGSGTEFRRLDEILAANVPVLVPLNYPDAPDVSSVHAAEFVSLRDLQTWEQAPTNARRLHAASVPFAFTTHRLSNASTFRAALRDAVRHGLDEDAALAALTTMPADLLGVSDRLGTIAPGRVANLVVVDGSIFDPKAKIRDVWVEGRRHEINAAPAKGIAVAGRFATSLGHELVLELDTAKSNATFRALPGPDAAPAEGEPAPAEAAKPTKAKSVSGTTDHVEIVVDASVLDAAGWARLSGAWSNDQIDGTGMLPDGTRFTWTLVRDDALAAPKDAKEGKDAEAADASPRGRGGRDGAGADDPVTGEWSMSERVEGMPDAFPFGATLALAADGAVSGTLAMMDQSLPVSGRFDRAGAALELRYDAFGQVATLRGTVRDGRFEGRTSGTEFNAEITGSRAGGAGGDANGGNGRRDGGDAKTDDDAFEMPPQELAVPLGAYGRGEPLAAKDLLIVGATIWTAGPEGIIENGAILVRDGKIVSVHGSGRWPRIGGVEVLDLAGKHVTPGLIDCHSHTGISGGVNEFGQTNSAECRIGDCIDPDDIDWYRQLAGGLVAANQLHGSANPIGGQNSVVKIKWGGGPDDFRIPDAKPGIKFALGENVTRSRSRYPNTRMGVETFIRDAFTAARAYADEHARYVALPAAEKARTRPPAVDLELQTLAEILAGERIIHCHSYRQDEILMLIRVADDFGFRIGTFQHVLEGFKVADAIAKHGAGASSFSDWWAYKVEVMDAIPHNGTLMTDVGVNVSFNSDSDELARRMNTEAAKAVRYGGMPPAEAIKLVTINPAWQLGIDHRTGSIEAGKDADFVVWSTDPLSTYAVCEQTWIEGVRRFDRAEDRILRAAAEAERMRLIQKALVARNGKAKAPAVALHDGGRDGEHDHPADEITDAERARREEMIRLGLEWNTHRCGECGCAH